ncbi:MAG: hypothetical protein HY22_01460 [[Candidatus Thermochlorobacteriaceae] bacterium GBChlB]|jgi:hypothetical protein|nr:MAG: hypothetical protein HY22_01460 [[Candidatus Thermochlorobacteriaceae] bacterium GBChlB]
MSQPSALPITDTLDTIRTQLLSAAGDEVVFGELLRKVDAKQLKQLQEYFWDFIINESQSATTKRTRSEILSLLEPTAKYQQRARCQEPLGYCTISMCVRINPSCAVTRISGVMQTIRPLLKTLLDERPELLGGAANTSVTPPAQASPQFAPHEGVIRRERKPEVITDEMRQRFAKYREMLWSMIEEEGLEHAILMTEQGNILQHATTKKQEMHKITALMSEEIFAVTEQGEAAKFQPLLTVTKEFEKAVVAMRSIGNGLYLVGVSQTVLPARIHSLIVRLGSELKNEIAQ